MIWPNGMIATLVDPIQAERITSARVKLVVDYPWFGMLALNLTVRENTAAPTLQTDGTHLDYNPAYIAGLSRPQLTGVVAHEVMHCAMLHPYRTRDLDPGRANRAADYAINPIIIDAGMELPAGALIERRFYNKSFEQIYAILSREDEQPDAKPQPSPCHFTPAPDQPGNDQPNDQPGDMPSPGQPDNQPGPASMSEVDWQIASEQAASIMRKAGTLDADLERLIKSTRESMVDWREALKHIIEQTMPSDRAWSRPDRRFSSSGMILPGVVKENTPKLVVAADISGSMSQSTLELGLSELTGLNYELRPAEIVLITCDTRIQSVETFTPDDGELTISTRGGGGTRFAPVFDYIEAMDEPPAALIFFTDLMNSDTILTEPSYPVLWLTDDTTREVGKFGETVRIPPVR